MQALGQLTRAKSRRREDTILFAVGLLREQHAHHSHAGSAPPPFSAAEFEKRLREALAAGDNLHDRFKAQWTFPDTL